MRLQVQTDVTVRPPDGRMVHGTLVWLDGQKLEAKLMDELKPHEVVDVRIDLRGLSGSVVTQALVVSVGEPNYADERTTRMLLEGLSAADEERLLDWADSTSQGRAPRGAVSWLDSRSVSEMRSGSGRSDLRKALREGISKQVASDPVWVRKPKTEGREVTVLDDEVTVAWSDPARLRRDLKEGLKRGRLPVDAVVKPNITLRLKLPDGQVLAVPAVSEQGPGGSTLNFRLALPLKQKLKRASTSKDSAED